MSHPVTSRTVADLAHRILLAVVLLAACQAWAEQPAGTSQSEEPLPLAAQLLLSEIMDIQNQVRAAGTASPTDSEESRRIFAEKLSEVCRQASEQHPVQPAPYPASAPKSPADPSQQADSTRILGYARPADAVPVPQLPTPLDPWLAKLPALLNPRATGDACVSSNCVTPQPSETRTLCEASVPSPVGSTSVPSPVGSTSVPSPVGSTSVPSDGQGPVVSFITSPVGPITPTPLPMITSLRQTSSQLDQLANQLECERRYHDADQLRQLAQRLRAEARERDSNPPIESNPAAYFSSRGPRDFLQPTPPPDGTYPAVIPASAGY
ncbi:MAG: hypothetical protein U0795_17160 [Pirellulales bacterium]